MAVAVVAVAADVEAAVGVEVAVVGAVAAGPAAVAHLDTLDADRGERVDPTGVEGAGEAVELVLLAVAIQCLGSNCAPGSDLYHRRINEQVCTSCSYVYVVITAVFTARGPNLTILFPVSPAFQLISDLFPPLIM